MRANLELLADNSALLGRTGSVLENLLLPRCVTSWGMGRLDMDFCSLQSRCPEAEGAFCLGIAGLCPFLGAVEKLPCGSHESGGCVVCILVKTVLAVGTSQRSVLQAS